MQKIGTWLLKGMLRLLSGLPLGVHYALGGLVGWLARDVVRYRRKVVDHNLALCFPDKTDKERRAIRRGFYRHFGRQIAETVWLRGCPRDKDRLRRQGMVELENPETVSELYDASSSVVVLGSHYGNWELTGCIFSDKPLSFGQDEYCVVYRRQSSPAWDKIMYENRQGAMPDPERYKGLIETQDILRYAFRHHDEKKVYTFITDQRPYAVSRAFAEVDFLGQHTYTMTGAAALAAKFDMAVVYLSMHPDRRGHYLFRFTPICRNAAEMDVRQIMQQYYQLLEEDIRRQPECYLWTHRRFKKPKNLQTQ